ncbi:SUMF1/EgtB/PvdO family nonheme iron enzyme [Streptomyces gramineus]
MAIRRTRWPGGPPVRLGGELTPGGRWRCTIRQGQFPHTNTGEDGHVTTAPVKTYPPNGFGLWNTTGNVWEWCADRSSPETDQRGPDTGTARVTRGGSHLRHGPQTRTTRTTGASPSGSP